MVQLIIGRIKKKSVAVINLFIKNKYYYMYRKQFFPETKGWKRRNWKRIFKYLSVAKERQKGVSAANVDYSVSQFTQ